jgi:hypothetical protein
MAIPMSLWGHLCQDAGATDEGNAFVYYGSASGIPTTPSVTLDNPANQVGGFLAPASLPPGM